MSPFLVVGENHDEPGHFLESCFLCRKPLGLNCDIFMYRLACLLLVYFFFFNEEVHILLFGLHIKNFISNKESLDLIFLNKLFHSPKYLMITWILMGAWEILQREHTVL